MTDHCGKMLGIPMLALLSVLLAALPSSAAPKNSERQLSRLAAPQEIELKGNIRRENISGPLGPIELRWPRTVEVLFGRTPLHAMTDAARTVDRAIRTSAFPSELQRMNVDWKVVFMDEKLPEAQIPARLIDNCHPGWMTPPANIYIVAQRVASGCGSSSSRRRSSVADADLAEVIIHEMGHAVEYQLLKDRFPTDRMRAEGFATWFEMYASGYSSVAHQSAIKKSVYDRAAFAIRQNPDAFTFGGDSLDYARAGMYFEAITAKRGIGGLMDVYKAMAGGMSLSQAIQSRLNWNQEQLNKEVMRLLSKK